MILGISGTIGSGKDITCKIIQYLTSKYDQKNNKSFIYKDDYEIGSEWKSKKFAGKLKDIVCLLISCSREQLENREFRDIPLGKQWNVWKVTSKDPDNYGSQIFTSEKEALESHFYEWAYQPIIEEIVMTPRLMMQLLGTEVGRNIIHPDLWVLATFSDYTSDSKLLISDVRFPNEISKIKEKNGIVIRIERDFSLRHPGYNNLEEVQDKDPELYKQLTHYSETALDEYNEFDYIIQNNGTIDELIEKIKQIIESYERSH